MDNGIQFLYNHELMIKVHIVNGRRGELQVIFCLRLIETPVVQKRTRWWSHVLGERSRVKQRTCSLIYNNTPNYQILNAQLGLLVYGTKNSCHIKSFPIKKKIWNHFHIIKKILKSYSIIYKNTHFWDLRGEKKNFKKKKKKKKVRAPLILYS